MKSHSEWGAVEWQWQVTAFPEVLPCSCWHELGGREGLCIAVTPLRKHIVIAIICNSLSLWKSLRSSLRSLQVPQSPLSTAQAFTPSSLVLCTRCCGELWLGSLATANLLLFLLFGGSGQGIHSLLSPSSLLAQVLLLEEVSLPCAFFGYWFSYS